MFPLPLLANAIPLEGDVICRPDELELGCSTYDTVDLRSEAFNDSCKTRAKTSSSSSWRLRRFDETFNESASARAKSSSDEEAGSLPKLTLLETLGLLVGKIYF